VSVRVLVIGREGHVVEAVLPVIRAHGIEAAGATADADAVEALDAGGVSLLIIGGGVEPRSRDTLRSKARSWGAIVVETPLRDRNIDDYVEQEIVPRLRAGSGERETENPSDDL
jgi:hypothetical protein